MPQAYRDLAIIIFNMGALYYNSNVSKNEAKKTFERVVEIGIKGSDDYLNKLAKKAKDILDKYF
jgi:hypothetical protein